MVHHHSKSGAIQGEGICIWFVQTSAYPNWMWPCRLDRTSTPQQLVTEHVCTRLKGSFKQTPECSMYYCMTMVSADETSAQEGDSRRYQPWVRMRKVQLFATFLVCQGDNLFLQILPLPSGLSLSWTSPTCTCTCTCTSCPHQPRAIVCQPVRQSWMCLLVFELQPSVFVSDPLCLFPIRPVLEFVQFWLFFFSFFLQQLPACFNPLDFSAYSDCLFWIPFTTVKVIWQRSSNSSFYSVSQWLTFILLVFKDAS